MPTSVKVLVAVLLGVGVGFIAWVVGYFIGLDSALIWAGSMTYMDVKGALAIGCGALAAVGEAKRLFRRSGAA
jgi:hypothetical protein